MPSQPEIRVLETPDDLFRAAADEFQSLAADAVRKRGRFCVALSGGSTPRQLYSLLASRYVSAIPWERTYFFFGDERNVPPDHPDSNYRMANEAMLSKAPVPRENVFRVPAEKEAQAAARDYEQSLKTFFGLGENAFPPLDLIFLGVGPDGHTASLFPGTAACNERQRLVVANWVEKFKTYRITLTYPVLNHAACVMFLASGGDKAAILREVMENPKANLPAQKVHPEDGRLIWLLDRAAASALSR